MLFSEAQDLQPLVLVPLKSPYEILRNYALPAPSQLDVSHRLPLHRILLNLIVIHRYIDAYLPPNPLLHFNANLATKALHRGLNTNGLRHALQLRPTNEYRAYHALGHACEE